MYCVQLKIYDPLMLAITLFVYFMLLSYSIALLPQHFSFFAFEPLYRWCDCYIIYSGAKACFEEVEGKIYYFNERGNLTSKHLVAPVFFFSYFGTILTM
jgi:hypothetical protein